MARGERGRGDVPRLLLVADGFATGSGGFPAEEIRARSTALVRAGVPWVMLRDHAAPDAAFRDAAERLAADLRAARPGVRLAVNARLEAALSLGADLHVGRRGPAVADARAAGVPAVGVSAHDAAELAAAARDGAAYATLSPVFPTASHPGAPALGVEALAGLVASARLPVLALGGISAGRVADVLAAGAHGVAVLGALLHAADPARAAEAFLRTSPRGGR